MLCLSESVSQWVGIHKSSYDRSRSSSFTINDRV